MPRRDQALCASIRSFYHECTHEVYVVSHNPACAEQGSEDHSKCTESVTSPIYRQGSCPWCATLSYSPARNEIRALPIADDVPFHYFTQGEIGRRRILFRDLIRQEAEADVARHVDFFTRLEVIRREVWVVQAERLTEREVERAARAATGRARRAERERLEAEALAALSPQERIQAEEDARTREAIAETERLQLDLIDRRVHDLEIADRAARAAAELAEEQYGPENFTHFLDAELVMATRLLPVAILTEEEEDENCGICQEELLGDSDDEPLGIRRLPCNHLFHASCIMKWFEGHGSNSNRCPVCRRDYNIKRFYTGHPIRRNFRGVIVQTGGHVHFWENYDRLDTWGLEEAPPTQAEIEHAEAERVRREMEEGNIRTEQRRVAAAAAAAAEAAAGNAQPPA